MKTFKNLVTLKTALLEHIAWKDYIKVDGKVYRMYEYGGGSMFRMSYSYVYFVNKKTHDAIYVKYDCPSYEWEKTGNVIKDKKNQIKDPRHSYDEQGVERIYIQTLKYRFIDMEFIPNMELWRTDTI